jgi:hypothetical protein
MCEFHICNFDFSVVIYGIAFLIGVCLQQTFFSGDFIFKFLANIKESLVKTRLNLYRY